MKKEAIINIVLGTILILSMFYLGYKLSAPKLQFSPIEFTQKIPSDCSNSALKETWNQIFQEDSENIIILTDESSISTSERNGVQITRCPSYLAYKIKNDEEIYLLYGSFSAAEPETTLVNAIKASVIPEYISILQNLTAFNQDALFNNEKTIPEQYLKENTRSQEEAATSLETSFKIDPLATWEPITGVGEPNSIALIQNVTQNIVANQKNFTAIETNILTASLSKALTRLYFIETLIALQTTNPETTPEASPTPENQEPIIDLCQSFWVPVNSSCKEDETYIIWYNDTNACNTSNSIRPQNQTKDCDFNKDNILGKKESIEQINIETEVYINSEPLSYTEDYEGTLKVEIKEDSISRIEFNYTFEEPLNLKNIKIEKQPYESKFGYLIVEGLNYTKTLKIDRINSSNTKVCIINKQINDISEFTSKCNSIEEILIRCPGQNSSFSCDIINNQFIVSGLSNSAVREISLPETSTIRTNITRTTANTTENTTDITFLCEEYWSCSEWSECISNTKTRECTDLNYCQTNISKPEETESCTSFSPCEPNWQCTDWKPKKCPSNKEQTRECTDLNYCETTAPTTESKTCEYAPSSISMQTIIFLGIIIIIALLLVITYLLIKKTTNSAPAVQYLPINRAYKIK